MDMQRACCLKYGARPWESLARFGMDSPRFPNSSTAGCHLVEGTKQLRCFSGDRNHGVAFLRSFLPAPTPRAEKRPDDPGLLLPRSRGLGAACLAQWWLGAEPCLPDDGRGRCSPDNP